MEIERRDNNTGSVIRRSIAWAIKEGMIENKLDKEGIHTLYCSQEQNESNTRVIRILEQRGKYSLMIDQRNVYTSNDLGDCFRWGCNAGYINRKDVLKAQKATISPFVKAERTDTRKTNEAVKMPLEQQNNPRKTLMTMVFSNGLK